MLISTVFVPCTKTTVKWLNTCIIWLSTGFFPDVKTCQMLMGQYYVRNKMMLCLYNLIVHWPKSTTKLDHGEAEVSIAYLYLKLRSSLSAKLLQWFQHCSEVVLKRKRYIVTGWMDESERIVGLLMKSMCCWTPVHALALPFASCVVLVSHFPNAQFPVVPPGSNGTHFIGLLWRWKQVTSIRHFQWLARGKVMNMCPTLLLWLGGWFSNFRLS